MMVLLALQVVAGIAGAAAPAPRVDAARFDAIVEDGIRRGAYPGAVLVIGRRDAVVFAKGYGHFTWRAGGRRPDPDSTVWDIASLTKVVATTTALMHLVERGRVALDSPVVRYLPAWRAPRADRVTVRQLLSHTSGLPAYLPLHRMAPDRDSALRIVYATGPRAGTAGVVYSDLNAILLGELVGTVTGVPLDEYWRRETGAPLGLGRSTFRPPRAWRRWTVPTGVWRGTPVAGVVNDPNAHILGGVAGHAGLFASAHDLARFAQLMLAEGVLPDGRRLLRRETIQAFTRMAVPARGGASARALGWQALPTDEAVSSAGTRLGPRTYGHTGWTGTSLWIDPDRDLFVLLLTNRAYAPRSSRSFTVLKEVRGRVADAAAEVGDAR
jgi:CubicO group peptidase (beta-lactamase class C family)